MKIAIYTLPFTWNYGGILQAYALKHYLKSLGHNVEIINRRTDTHNLFINLCKKIKWSVIPFLYHTRIFNKRPLISVENFKQKYLTEQSPLIFSSNQLKKYCNQQHFDAIIVGSDQIWRYGSAQNICDSFLHFVNGKAIKIAYAISFGNDVWNYPIDVTEKCKKYIKDFDIVTTRELSGVKLCQQFLSTKAYHVLDPTFLIDKKIYEEIANSQKNIITQGIYTYILDKNHFKEKIVKETSEHFNLSVFDIDSNPSVENWIQGFINSDFVITDSFHGTCFAIIFNKPFIAILNKDRGNARFESLAIMLNIKNRFISEDSDISNILDQTIDFEKINNIIKQKKEESYNLLNKVLNGTETL